MFAYGNFPRYLCVAKRSFPFWGRGTVLQSKMVDEVVKPSTVSFRLKGVMWKFTPSSVSRIATATFPRGEVSFRLKGVMWKFTPSSVSRIATATFPRGEGSFRLKGVMWKFTPSSVSRIATATFPRGEGSYRLKGVMWEVTIVKDFISYSPTGIPYPLPHRCRQPFF